MFETCTIFMFSDIPIKTAEEIELMRQGGRILADALNMLSEKVKPGMTTLDLDLLAEDFIRSHNGAEPGFKGYRGFPGTLCTSVNEEVVHGIPRKDVVLMEGDVVGLDCGVLFGGFYTDACVSVLIGQADPELNHFVKTTKKALQNALKQVREGAKVGDLSAVIQKTLEDQSYSPVIECTGHGVGKNLHEPPEILNAGHRGEGATLKAGMTLAIEPISAMGSGEVDTAKDGWTVITADGSLSAHFEHTILVTQSGFEILA